MIAFLAGLLLVAVMVICNNYKCKELRLIMWLIIKTGYEQKRNDHPAEKGGERE